MEQKRIKEFKVIFLGDAAVGKSSIIHRYLMNKFQSHPESTLGTAFFSKTIFNMGKVVKLNIWDTAGEEKFRAVTSAFYRGNIYFYLDADAAILVYDMTNLDSLDGVDYFREELRHSAQKDICKRKQFLFYFFWGLTLSYLRCWE